MCLLEGNSPIFCIFWKFILRIETVELYIPLFCQFGGLIYIQLRTRHSCPSNIRFTSNFLSKSADFEIRDQFQLHWRAPEWRLLVWQIPVRWVLWYPWKASCGALLSLILSLQVHSYSIDCTVGAFFCFTSRESYLKLTDAYGNLIGHST